MERQEELFKEFGSPDEARRSYGKEISPRKAFTLTVTYEKAIVAFFITVIVCALIFVVGFERGRRSILARRVVGVRAAVPAGPAATYPAAAVKKEPPPAQQAQGAKPYTIQVAAFRTRQFALDELEKLKRAGFQATIREINGLYVIEVGGFADQKEALPALTALRRAYRDCQLRKR